MSSDVAGKTFRLRPRLIAIAVLVFVPLSFVFHYPAFSLGWWADDPYILETVIFSSWFDFFWRPELYQQLSMWNFTPMLAPSYAVDYALFHLDPWWFYAHQIALLGLIAAGVFLLVSRWSAWAAAIAGLLFLLSGPATVCSQTLMTRHYLDGAVAALICVLLLVSTDRLGWRSWLAGLAFLAAVLAKEVYVPLVFVAPLLSPLRRRRGLWVSIPMFAALLIYVPLRFYMLAGTSGHWQFPWGNLIQPGWWLSGLRGVAAMLCSYSTGSPWWVELAVLAATLALVVLLVRRRRIVIAAITAAGVIGSMLPVWADLVPDHLTAYRYTVHLALVASVAAGYFLAALRRIQSFDGRDAMLAVSAVLGLISPVLFMHKFALARQYLDSQYQASRQVEFLFTAPPEEVLVSHEPVNYWESIARIRREVLGEATPVVCSLPFDLRGKQAKYLRYENVDGRYLFRDITAEFRTARNTLLARQVDTDFVVDIRVADGQIHIDLDRDKPKTTYRLLRGGVSNAYEAHNVLPTSSGGGYLSPHSYFIRVIKFTADGHCILSPEWNVKLDTDRVIHWER